MEWHRPYLAYWQAYAIGYHYFKENGMDIIKGILVGVALALVIKFAMAGGGSDSFEQFRGSEAFSQFR